MAARVVRRQRLLSLAGDTRLQNARARSAVALSGLHHLPAMRRQTLSTRGVALSGFEWQHAADPRRLLSASGSRRVAICEWLGFRSEHATRRSAGDRSG